jgi:hypothetical protein
MMAAEYYDIPDSAALPDVSGLTIPRARKLVSAIERHRDFKVVNLFRRENLGSEIIVVDVEIDAVPPSNPYGILYRERLALIVPADPKRLVEVRALRKDFPILPHQNAVAPGKPASLCLYFEPPISVSRTWTPQEFLRRIQWWMEKTAKGDLHPADQPVEQLFFSTRYELILPWNLA